MKKIFITLIIILAILIGSAIVVPIIFKDKILVKVQEVINENVNAKVEFADFNLSLFRSFPNIQAELVNFTVIGENEFEGDTLAAISSLSTDIAIADLFSDEGLDISSIKLSNAVVNLLVRPNGAANWDIVPASEEEISSANTESADASFGISLNSVIVENLNLKYIDETFPMTIELRGFELDASGKLNGMITNFDINSKVKEFVVNYDSVEYISNTTLSVESKLMADLDKFAFEFGESRLHLNALPIDVTGSFSMPSDTMHFDIHTEVPQSDFKTILSLIPADYQQYIEGVTANGEAGFVGNIKGFMHEEEYPAMDFNLYVKDADMQYADMPEKINGINFDLNIMQPQGDLDKMLINLSKFEASIRNNPINAQLLLSTPMSDMNFDAMVSAMINFATVKDAIPMEDINLAGELNGKLNLRGTMSAVEKEQYDKVDAEGLFTLNNLVYESADLTQAIKVTKGAAKFNSQKIEISQFNASVGSSDFKFSGSISNHLPYLFMDKTLNGTFSLYSSNINCDELMNLMVETEEEPASTIEAASDSSLIFQIPDKLNLAFKSNIDKLTYSTMNITNIDGLITAKNKKLILQNLDMNMLGGKLALNGSYQGNEKDADVDFAVKINPFTIPAAYQTFTILQKYLPIAKKSTGDLYSDISVKGKLDEQLNFIASTLNGSGSFSGKNVQLANTETTDKFKAVFKADKLENMKMKDFTANFNIKDGNVLVEPFTTSLAGQEVKVDGSVLVDLTADLNLGFQVHKSDLSSNISSMLNAIPGASKIETYPIDVKIKGDITSPSVTPDLTKATTLITNELKNSAKENLDKAAEKAVDKIKGLFGN